MTSKAILLVEDSSDDEALTIRALQRSNISNEVVVAHDGVEALDYLFGRGDYAGRDTSHQPAVVLLDLKFRLSGIEVLRQLRADSRTGFVPVVIQQSL
jgi:CheY-like chemotaxis protein